MSERLNANATVRVLAHDLGLPSKVRPVQQITQFCEHRIARWLAELPGKHDATTILNIAAAKLSTTIIEVHTDAELITLQQRYVSQGEPGFAFLKSDFDSGVLGITLRLLKRKAFEPMFVSVINCIGRNGERAYFTKWHELVHLLTLTDQTRLAFKRTHVDCSQKDPEEALVDVVAGALAYHPKLLRPYTRRRLSFALVDEIREKVFSVSSRQAALLGITHQWPKPCVLLRIELAGKHGSLKWADADSLELLPEWHGRENTFATAEWYTERKRWVFLTSSAAYREKVLPLHSAWLDLFILRMMGYCEDPAVKPVWFVLDELASLNKLPQLHTAVTENRKYGNPVVMGIQGRSQMEKRYGQDAEAMLSQPATKIFLKTSEPRAAKWISESIGEIEVERLKESRSMGLLRSKKSFAMEIATKPLIMASEIAGLAPLTGFIKLENHVVPARFRLAKKRNKQSEFIERALEKARPRKVEVVKTATTVTWRARLFVPLDELV